MRARATAFGVIGLLVWYLLGPAPAFAHSSLAGSSPAAGATVAAAPRTVRLEFTGSMAGPASVVVTGPDGSSVADGPPTVDGRVVTQRLLGGSTGTYTVAYRVFSSDGSPVSGRFTFAVGTGGPPAAPTSSGPPPATATAVAVAASPAGSDQRSRRVVLAWAGAGVLFGGAAVLLLLARRAPGEN